MDNKINWRKKIVGFMLCLGAMFLFCSTTSMAAGSEKESNNKYSTANSITPGKSIKGSMSKGTDKDYFKIVAPADGKLSISFQHKYSEKKYTWGVDIYRYVNNEYKKLCSDEISSTSNENYQLPFIGAHKDGIYYIVVYEYQGNSNSVGVEYTINTSFLNSDYYEKEVNDSYDSATTMALNNKYTGTIGSPLDKDYYKIVAPSNGAIYLNFLHKYSSTRYTWGLGIYRYTNGSYVKISDVTIQNNSNENVTLPFIGAQKDGVYYITVEEYVGNCNSVGVEYTLSTSFKASNYYEIEPNGSYGSANPIKLNAKYTGTINSSNESDFYKIVAPTSGKISICFQHKYSSKMDSWDIDVYRYAKGSYKKLSSTTVSASGKEKKNLPPIGAVKGGVYYIKVYRATGDMYAVPYSIKASQYLKPLSKMKAKPSKKKVTLTWKKIKGVTYQIQIKKKGKYVTLKDAKKNTYIKKNKFVIKSLKSKKKCYFRVRYRKVINGSFFYSEWKNVNSRAK